jgi:two-component system sensor histidine kinase CpxA
MVLISQYKIFIKIFLWFWLATIVMMETMRAIDRATEPKPFPVEMKSFIGSAFSVYGQASLEIFEHEGASSLRDFIGHLKKTTDINFYLFDDNGRELTGRKGPEGIERMVATVRKTGRDGSIVSLENGFLARRISGRNGHTYIIAGNLPRPPPGPFPEKPPSLLFRLGVMILISGAGCYWLAQYVTTPIIKLGYAVRQFSAGKHSIRVNPEMGNRNDEISALANDFDLMANRIESLLTSQRTLLRDISHELRSPLARLNVALELCWQRSDAESGKFLDRIERESERLNHLIGQILILNRYESGIPLPDITSIDLAKLIREIADDADFEARSSNRAVKLVDYEEIIVKGSEESLRRAVENVVRNAVRYTVEGSEVKVSLQRERDGDTPYASITVRDYGPGVPEDEIVYLFKPFYRVGEDRNRLTGGAGLGLAITEAAVRFHGGSVKASNAPGGGLIVEIQLPES